jgi:hypothetical protein
MDDGRQRKKWPSELFCEFYRVSGKAGCSLSFFAVVGCLTETGTECRNGVCWFITRDYPYQLLTQTAYVSHCLIA